MKGQAAGRETICLLPPADAPLTNGGHEWIMYPSRREKRSSVIDYDSWWPGEFAERVAATVRRHGVALVFAGDESPHCGGLLCTPEMVVDFDARSHTFRETTPLRAVIDKCFVLGFGRAKVDFTAEKANTCSTDASQWDALGPVAEMLRGQSEGVLSCLDEACGKFSFLSPSSVPEMEFSSAKVMFDMVGLGDALAAMNGGVRPRRASLLIGSHLPLIPADVAVSLQQRVAYAPGGAEELKRMAEDVYPQHPSSTALTKKSKSDEGIATRRLLSDADVSSEAGLFESESGVPALLVDDEESTCHVASCIMSLEAALAFSSAPSAPSREVPGGSTRPKSAVEAWPLDVALADGTITFFASASNRKRLTRSGDGEWGW